MVKEFRFLNILKSLNFTINRRVLSLGGYFKQGVYLKGSVVKKYVTGFLFSSNSSHIVLIKKLTPAWQKGYLNGVGGKIEANETSENAMSREFKEETGVFIPAKQWHCYAQINRPNHYHVDFFFAHSELAFTARTVEKEEILVVKLSELPTKLIPNLNWLIPLALDKQADFSVPVKIKETSTERVKA